MNTNSFEPSHEPPQDPLLDDLRREAMSERLPVSQNLHQQILQGIRGKRASKMGWDKRWIPHLAAAAILLMAICVAMVVATRRTGPNPTTSSLSSSPVKDEPDKRQALSVTSSTFRAGELLEAKLWPPEISINVPWEMPIAKSETKSLRSSDSIISPESAISAVQKPSDDAQTALAELVPADMRTMGEMLWRIHQNQSR